MINVKDAVKVAYDFLVGMYQEESLRDLRLDEVVLSEDDRHWFVTLSFLPPLPVASIPPSDLATALGAAPVRQYKLVTVENDSGKVRSMVMRSWYEGPETQHPGAIQLPRGAR